MPIRYQAFELGRGGSDQLYREFPMKVVECELPSGSVLSREWIERAYFHDFFKAPLKRRDLGFTIFS